MDEIIGSELGGCRVLERLGGGGMGTVYKAHHLRLDRDVAPQGPGSGPGRGPGFRHCVRARGAFGRPPGASPHRCRSTTPAPRMSFTTSSCSSSTGDGSRPGRQGRPPQPARRAPDHQSEPAEGPRPVAHGMRVADPGGSGGSRHRHRAIPWAGREAEAERHPWAPPIVPGAKRGTEEDLL